MQPPLETRLSGRLLNIIFLVFFLVFPGAVAKTFATFQCISLPEVNERYPELAQASAPKPRGRRRGPANDEAHIDVLAPSVGGARMIIGKQARSVIRERVGDREFRVDDAGFWQVHEAAPQTLTEAVQSGIVEDLFDPKAANLDLYGGVGLLAAATLPAEKMS